MFFSDFLVPFEFDVHVTISRDALEESVVLQRDPFYEWTRRQLTFADFQLPQHFVVGNGRQDRQELDRQVVALDRLDCLEMGE